ncbi:hypothetical protein M9Y10_015676 [Tritrichomonas musculus]|uniref:DUF3447 domain-containing protein n=1 Tax=Tritrichomonas musculus TaxID=1915356 RepID=A0ABR2L3V6_9EUKA
MENVPEDYFKKLRDIEEKLHLFLQNQDDQSTNLILFIEDLQEAKLLENKYELKSFLHLVVAISNNCHRSQLFFSNIDLLLKSLYYKIQYFFTNFEIFHIFQRNKRLLLFLFNLKILKPTKEIYSVIITNKKCIEGRYLEYFFPEFESFIDKETKKSIGDQIPELKERITIDIFNQKREKGENDNYLCNLIQNDLIVDFISYVERTNISLFSTIPSSIFETNLLLINKNPTLIEYSAFYGSIQIIQYLNLQNVGLETTIWPFAIHGRNAEVIRFLEENKVKSLHNSFQYLIVESIKCHHNEIADYFRNNFCDEEKIYDYYLYRKALKYYNFAFFTNDMINSIINSCKFDLELNIPYYLSKYDYYLIIEFLLKCTMVEKGIIFNRYKNILDINHQYTIYKSCTQYSGDIVDYIAINNGDIPKCQEPENNLKKIASYMFHQKEVEIYTKYEYDIETSTVLNIAARKGNIDIIQLLISKNEIDVNAKSTRSYKKPKKSYGDMNLYYLKTEEKTVLHEAIESEYIEVVQYLLNNQKVDINCKHIERKTYQDYLTTGSFFYDKKCEKELLHFAIKKGHIGIIELLLSNPKIDINSISTSWISEGGGCITSFYSSTILERSSLYFAIKKEDIKVIQLFLSQPKIDVNSGIKEYSSYDQQVLQDISSLYLAVDKQNFEIVLILLMHPKINVKYESTSYYISQDHRKIMQLKTALELAISKQNNEIHQLLLSKTSNRVDF